MTLYKKRWNLLTTLWRPSTRCKTLFGCPLSVYTLLYNMSPLFIWEMLNTYSSRGCTKIRIPHTYVPPPLPPRRGEIFFFCIQFFLFSNALPALYNASYASNTCQIPTKCPRGEHLRATEGSSAWLHLTVDDVGTGSSIGSL